MDSTTFRVPEVNLYRLEQEFDVLNKKAKKLGCEPVSFRILSWDSVEVTDPVTGEPKAPYIRKWAHIEVEGPTPRLSGWTFAAKIEPTDAGNLVKALPGVGEIPLVYRTTGTYCDHCKTDRYRLAVFVVKHDDGRWAQVGRNCLADFIGGTSPETLVRIAEWLADAVAIAGDADEDGWGGGSGFPRTEPTEGFLTVVAACSRLYGFVPKSKASFDDRPTAGLAWAICTDPKEAERFTKERGFVVEERDIRLAQAALEWAKAVEPTNDYLHNVKISATLPTVDDRTVGIAASIVGSYMRHIEKVTTERKQVEAGKVLRHVGTEGTREVFGPLTVAAIFEFDGDYGVYRIIKLLDNDGNCLVWKTSALPDWAEQGEVVTVKGTVKCHVDYQGTPQTELSRVTAVAVARIG